MIRLSKKADYSLMALKHILSKENQPSSTREIAQTYGIPFEVLAKLLQQLTRKGFLISQHGTKGGYSPAKLSGAITVRDVLEAIEGPQAILDCSNPRKGPCEQEKSCSVRRPLARVEQKVLDLLGKTTLGEI
ncbi:MAG TPA: Rrf2 family transcriptional regulator [Candidatus Polarisedimenticolia bacterium]|nr:Rrf2 family transcriptional regulator [Candidatus Polarisedimenticolia bacterium]